MSTTGRAQQSGTLLTKENSSKAEDEDRRRLFRVSCGSCAWSWLRTAARSFIGRPGASTRATESSMARQEALPSNEASSSLMAVAHKLNWNRATFDPARRNVRCPVGSDALFSPPLELCDMAGRFWFLFPGFPSRYFPGAIPWGRFPCGERCTHKVVRFLQTNTSMTVEGNRRQVPMPCCKTRSRRYNKSRRQGLRVGRVVTSKLPA